MVALMVTNEVPNFIAALIACLLMGKFRCIDMESAYRSIHWPKYYLDCRDDAFCGCIAKNWGYRAYR